MFLNTGLQFKYAPASQCGSSLIEILVSMLIIGIGMLGVASLQVFSLSSVKVSSVHTQASILTENLAERMRTNPDAVTAGEFTNLNIDTSAAAPAAPANLCRDATNPCTPAEFIAAEKWQWEMLAREILPAASTITVDCNGGAGSCTADNAHIVTVQWEEETRTGMQAAGYTTVIQP
ncbi:MAG: type IV pilus modification protein PilV [Thiotrichales bacterium]